MMRTAAGQIIYKMNLRLYGYKNKMNKMVSETAGFFLV